MEAQTASFVKHYGFRFPRLSLWVASCSCEQATLISTREVPDAESLRYLWREANTLSCGIQRELGTVETQAPGLIELKKLEVVGEVGQTFHLAGVRK